MKRVAWIIAIVGSGLILASCSKAYDLIVANPCNEDFHVTVSTNGSGEWSGEVRALSMRHIDDALAAPPKVIEIRELELSLPLRGTFTVIDNDKAYNVVIPAEECR